MMWKSPQTLAGEVYAWACRAEILGTVFTVYELHAGDDNHDSGFHGVDPVTLRRALDLLEAAGKVLLWCNLLRDYDILILCLLFAVHCHPGVGAGGGRSQVQRSGLDAIDATR